MSPVPSEFLSTFLNFSDPKLRCEFILIGFSLSAFTLFLKSWPTPELEEVMSSGI